MDKESLFSSEGFFLQSSDIGRFRRLREMLCRGEGGVLLYGENLALMEHYSEMLLETLRRDKRVSIESFMPGSTSNLLKRVNPVLQSLTIDQAREGHHDGRPARVWVLHDAATLNPGELDLAVRLITDFPGARIALLLLGYGLEKPPEFLERLFKRKLVVWGVKPPEEESLDSLKSQADDCGFGEEVSRLIDKAGLTLTRPAVPLALAAPANPLPSSTSPESLAALLKERSGDIPLPTSALAGPHQQTDPSETPITHPSDSENLQRVGSLLKERLGILQQTGAKSAIREEPDLKVEEFPYGAGIPMPKSFPGPLIFGVALILAVLAITGMIYSMQGWRGSNQLETTAPRNEEPVVALQVPAQAADTVSAVSGLESGLSLEMGDATIAVAQTEASSVIMAESGTSDVMMSEVVDTRPAQPETLVPEVAEPATSEAVVAQPEVSNPLVPKVGVGQPEVAKPAVTQTAVTQTALAQPDVTEAMQGENEPAVIKVDVAQVSVSGSPETELPDSESTNSGSPNQEQEDVAIDFVPPELVVPRVADLETTRIMPPEPEVALTLAADMDSTPNPLLQQSIILTDPPLNRLPIDRLKLSARPMRPVSAEVGTVNEGASSPDPAATDKDDALTPATAATARAEETVEPRTPIELSRPSPQEAVVLTSGQRTDQADAEERQASFPVPPPLEPNQNEQAAPGIGALLKRGREFVTATPDGKFFVQQAFYRPIAYAETVLNANPLQEDELILEVVSDAGLAYVARLRGPFDSYTQALDYVKAVGAEVDYWVRGKAEVVRALSTP